MIGYLHKQAGAVPTELLRRAKMFQLNCGVRGRKRLTLDTDRDRENEHCQQSGKNRR